MSNSVSKRRLSTPRLLARNVVLNIASQLFVAGTALVLLPLVIRGLGVEAYGLLALAMVLFGAFGILDAGLGRATTKYVAEYLTLREPEKLASVVWISLLIQLGLGLFAAVSIAVAAPFLATSVFEIRHGQLNDAVATLYVIAASIPVVLIGSTLRAALEGAQRFDFVTGVKVILNLSTYVVPVLLIPHTSDVWLIVMCIAVARLLGMIAFLVICLYALPEMRRRFSIRRTTLTALFRYSGWVAVSNVTVPLLVYIDRILIASLAGLSAITFYSAPYELLYGLWIIPSSICAVLLPAFSGLQAGDHLVQENLFVRPIKYILITLGPIVALVVEFADSILLAWLGPGFGQSTPVLQLLATGVLINSLAWVPMSLLGGLGHPDVAARIHLAQLPLYIAVAFPLVIFLGITGAAVAFCLRVIFEAVLLFRGSMRATPQTRGLFKDAGLRRALAVLLIFAALISSVGPLSLNLISQVIVAVAATLIMAACVWVWVFDARDRRWISSIIPLRNLE